MTRQTRCTLEPGATNHAIALTHDQRRAVIAEFVRGFFIRRIQPKIWGGLFIADALPREGRRSHKHNPWDEEAGTLHAAARDWGAD